MGGQGGRKKKVPSSSPTVAVPPPEVPKSPKLSTSSGTRARSGVVKVMNKASISASEERERGGAERQMALDAKTSSSLKKQLLATAHNSTTSAVLYLGHIPHGFYEEQMKGFFSQFGTVSRLRLARNKKTGRSKHYAFIEFKHKEVAEVVAKAMNGYLMFKKVLVAKVVPAEQVHPDTFKNAHRSFRIVDRTAVVRKHFNKPKPEAKAAKLQALGIDYEFGGYEASAAALPAAKRTRGVLAALPDAERAAASAPSDHTPSLESRGKRSVKKAKLQAE
eukprot:CAMPEP_0195649574 /NCGR_PEP_ID=MMETSP0815-20121206/31266_1 /TAXON_ID=97485 /ORGANISM="Prymnesium parvum, Strain Texoma1" /LENGTH=276 /DNA_ID=CAMNT_0040793341 /DNA_START=180 /DNA_END=1009 /DNA_ORIENTATION=+